MEWVVEMRRLPDENTADALLREGQFTLEQVQGLTRHLARFHATARTDGEVASYGDPELIERNVRENFAQTQASASRYVSRDELERAQAFQANFLRAHRARLEARVHSARIRDGHGDLRLEHCYLDPSGSIAIIDCIELNERFRYDVAADIAYLSMDLLWHERHDLSEALLAAYARASVDFDLYGVIDFYESYRAYVRGK